LVARYEAVSPARLFAPVVDLLPSVPSRIADIGAGTGRDAAWLATAGHEVVAVEPVAEFRRAGMALHPSPRIDWRDDRLPVLRDLIGRNDRFDCVLLTGVWHHLDAADRPAAMLTLAAVTAPGGRLVLSLRHGPGVPGRRMHPAPPEETIGAAQNAGFRLIRKCQAGSVQEANRAAGVCWTWLVFELL
jgi:SAM-dependent methyltransferase